MNLGVTLLLMVLAAYRLTRLVAIDEWPPVAHPREAFEDKHPDSAFTYLWNCPFCMSVWAAGLVTAVTWLVLTSWGDRQGLPMPVLVWGGVAGAVSLLYEAINRA